MAENSVIRRYRSPQVGKLLVYQQQCSINLALESVLLSCQQLQTLNIVPRGFLAHYGNMAEELRSIINLKIAEAMQFTEDQDARFFQGERLKWESRPFPRIRKKQ